MSYRTLYTKVLTQLQALTGTFGSGRVTEGDRAPVLGSEVEPAAIVYQPRGDGQAREINGLSASGSGIFSVDVDIYVPSSPSDTYQERYADVVDAAYDALSYVNIIGNTRKWVRTRLEPLNRNAVNTDCDAAGYGRTRIVVTAEELS